MDFIAKTEKVLTGACCTLVAYLVQLLGGWDSAISMLFLLMALDVFTGIIISFKRKSDHTTGGGFLSRAFFEGLSRKLVVMLMVILANALDGLLQTSISRVIVIGFYAANEAMSIIENAALLGVPFPKGLLKALERLRDTNDTTDPTER